LLVKDNDTKVCENDMIDGVDYVRCLDDILGSVDGTVDGVNDIIGCVNKMVSEKKYRYYTGIVNT
jgi:hypothetical protein